ncbi:hypothetical protein CPAV1605_357 [seawater metagenome]|uniref:Uncharacterized protein n=1 Tax=seawater metagenome TaxID=1561972 RepID=A0A5E8CLG6_9ZZZZ
MSENIICNIKYLRNNITCGETNVVLKDYKNNLIFEDFKKSIIRTAIEKGNNKIKLTINSEETIVFYVSSLNQFYLIEVFNIIDHKKHFIETLKFHKSRIILPYRYYNDLYWLPLLTLPMFFFF